MKNIITLLTITALLCSCAGYEPRTPWGKKALAWWQGPATQAKVETVKELVVSFAISSSLAALSQYASGGKLDFQKIALAGGVSTLYTGASKIRQLQGTYQVLDPEATAKLLEEGGASKDIANKLAGQLTENAGKYLELYLKEHGFPATSEEYLSLANSAAELNAAGLDKAALIVETATTNP